MDAKNGIASLCDMHVLCNVLGMCSAQNVLGITFLCIVPDELCALQVSSALRNLICSALQVPLALQSHEHNSEAKDLCGRICLLCGVVLAFNESLLDVNSVSSLIIDEGVEV